MEQSRPDIVCISHLWWDWVWQRPQHLITRLSERYRIFWAEEPRIEIGPEKDEFEIVRYNRNLHLSRLVYRSDHATFWERLNGVLDASGAHAFKVSEHITEAGLLFDSPVQPRLEREVVQYVTSWRRGPLVLWLYTPAVVKFIDLLEPDLVVYDVMDELSTFKFAPPTLRQQEEELMRGADLVFCGGPSLYESRRARHSDVHLFPSGVDQEHFARAMKDDVQVPADVLHIDHPVIGYYGVIDERIDLELLRQVAEARPDWNLVMIGPILKIQEDELPRTPNIHYLGKRGYEELPGYLKAFDVAMMPFALNESTQFISPTKTLEYMAACKPIVSTPVRDVASLYGEVVRIARSAEEFVDQVQRALDDEAGNQARVDKASELLHRYSWDNIVAEMSALVDSRLALKLATQTR